MRAYDIIQKKREGKKLTAEEIEFLISGYTEGEIPDYQISAWAMAVFFQGMDKVEIANLTEIMANSGDTIDLGLIDGKKVDKHSTGGVGDTTTLVLTPLVAACGAPVAKMSGRGLGHTGGTIDKLEAIPDFETALTMEEFVASVNNNKLAIAGQTGDLAPADKKLYALRDVTATVDSIPLIASSIMSKKIASGADAIVLDVKTGAGSFMKTKSEAVELAQTMVDIGKEVGRETIAIVSNMDQPLGSAVGNALEIKEAINTLKGKGPDDLLELCLTLGTQMLILAGVAETEKEAKKKLKTAIKSGSALEKFKDMITNQKGKAEVVDNLSLLPQAKNKVEIKATQGGYIQRIEAKEVGLSAMLLGAGRETKEAEIDLSVGVELAKKVGDKVVTGDILATLYYNNNDNLEQAKKKLKLAYKIGIEKPDLDPLIYEIIN